MSWLKVQAEGAKQRRNIALAEGATQGVIFMTSLPDAAILQSVI